MLLQIETALNHLSSNSATVEGILIGVIVMLVTFIVYLLKNIDNKETYIRQQDKENIEMFNALANKIASSEIGLADIKIEIVKIGEDVNYNKNLVTQVLTIIKERLKTKTNE